MKYAALALVLGGIAAPAWASNPLPRPDHVDWICGKAAMTTISGGQGVGAAELTLVSAPSVRWDFAMPAETSAAMTETFARAIHSPSIVAIGYVRDTHFPRVIDGVAHVVRVGDRSIGCSTLKSDARDAYARTYDAAWSVEAAKSSPKPKITRLKKWTR